MAIWRLRHPAQTKVSAFCTLLTSGLTEDENVAEMKRAGASLRPLPGRIKDFVDQNGLT
jgi:hypothetical protein